MNDHPEDAGSHLVIRGETIGSEQSDGAEEQALPDDRVCDICLSESAIMLVRSRGTLKQADMTLPSTLAACSACAEIIRSKDSVALSRHISKGNLGPVDVDPVAFLEAIEPPNISGLV